MFGVMVGRADGEKRLTGTSATAQYRHSAKALMTSGDAVLLVKEYHSDGTPFWTLPGGGVRPDESLAEGLHRELQEELDCHDVVIGEQAGHVWYAHRSRAGTISLYTVFECQALSEPTPNETEGVTEIRWVRPETLPPETLPQVRSVCRSALSSL